jgi:protein-L-isoaspartate(D-aspartate) O-methyltransferase
MKKFVVFVFVLINSCCVSFSADEYEKERQRMVEYDIKARGIKYPALLKAMAKVPRHRFVSTGFRHRAYADHPLPIAEGQTISQPYVVALMTELLELKSTDRVLEIGTGSGYQAAVLAEIVKEVYSIEIRKPLADGSRQLLQELGYKNVKVKYGDGYFGWPEHAPFDAIIITAAANHIPPPLIKQLKAGGRFILPLGSTVYYQMLTLVKKEGEEIRMKQFGSVRFVPMTGKVRE